MLEAQSLSDLHLIEGRGVLCHNAHLSRRVDWATAAHHGEAAGQRTQRFPRGTSDMGFIRHCIPIMRTFPRMQMLWGYTSAATW